MCNEDVASHASHTPAGGWVIVQDRWWNFSGDQDALILGHELSHVLGLHHTSVSGNLMTSNGSTLSTSIQDAVDWSGTDCLTGTVPRTVNQIGWVQVEADEWPANAVDPLGVLLPGLFQSTLEVDPLRDVPVGEEFVDISKFQFSEDSQAGRSRLTWELLDLSEPAPDLQYWALVDQDNDPVTGGDASMFPSGVPDTSVRGVEFIGHLLLDGGILVGTLWVFDSTTLRFVEVPQNQGVDSFFEGMRRGKNLSDPSLDAAVDRISLEFDTSLTGPTSTQFRIQAFAMDPNSGVVDRLDDTDEGVVLSLLPPIFPECIVAPDPAMPGDVVSVTAAGLIPSSGLHVILGDQAVATGVTDENGETMIPFTIPPGTSPGVRLVTVGVDGTALTADCTLNVLSPCEQSEFPICGEECPAGSECRADERNELCVCQPIPCDVSEFPTCGGECPGDSVCAPDEGSGLCACSRPVLPCDQGPFPTCGGECPEGFSCDADFSLEACVCAPPQCSDAAPVCGGECPQDQQCASFTEPGGTVSCRCEPIVCEQSGFPTCGGECPPDQQCASFTDPTTGETVCQCEPIRCEESEFPTCGGECPANSACLPNDLTGGCECAPLQCSDTAPTCGGECPPDQQCGSFTDPTTGETVCQCEPIVCEQSGFPTCGGECPINSVCTPDEVNGLCACEPIPCDVSEFPTCGGECPADSACKPSDLTGECVCEPLQCSDTAPTCGGECPVGSACQPDDLTGGCICAAVECGQSQAPACGGFCPLGTVCESLVAPDGTERCDCVTPPTPCEDTNAPMCGGACPESFQCQPSVGSPLCSCAPCDQVIPFGDITITWVSQTKFQWTGLECADVYNVYRGRKQHFVDSNNDNLADDYGTCFLPDLLDTMAEDFQTPVEENTFFHYLVTGENAVGEGDLMTNSFGMTRPNNTPCP